MKKIFMLCLVVVIVCTGCGNGNNKTNTANDVKTTEVKVMYKKLAPDEAKMILNSDEQIVILDVRTQEEYSEGNIKNSILLPDYEVDIKAASVLPDKNAKILVYCRSGNRSAKAANKLINMGYKNILDIGSISDYKEHVVK